MILISPMKGWVTYPLRLSEQKFKVYMAIDMHQEYFINLLNKSKTHKTLSPWSNNRYEPQWNQFTLLWTNFYTIIDFPEGNKVTEYHKDKEIQT